MSNLKTCENCECSHNGDYGSGRFCSSKCARGFSTKDKRSLINEKVSKTLTGTGNLPIHKICLYCNNEFIVQYKKRDQQCCSKVCGCKFYATTDLGIAHYKKMGILSAQSQNKRSKNEIYFHDLCKLYFKYVEANMPIFNGWDADVIIHDIKVAVLWNGKWHYEKITEKHSVKQVQNRDRIKQKEIINAGYTPYVIKDMGKYDPEFVELEFQKFIGPLSARTHNALKP